MSEQSSKERREQHLSAASQQIVQQLQELGCIPQEKRGVPALSLLNECMETIFVEMSEYLPEEQCELSKCLAALCQKVGHLKIEEVNALHKAVYPSLSQNNQIWRFSSSLLLIWLYKPIYCIA